MSIEHTNRWERVLLITACGAIRETRIPAEDVGKDIVVPLARSESAFVPFDDRPHEGSLARNRRFRYDVPPRGPSMSQWVYREQLP